MKRFFETLVILAVALPATVGTQMLAADAAHASVRTTTSVHSVQHQSGTETAHPRNSCTPRVEYNFTTTGTPQGGATQWITSCNLQQRVHIRCWDQLDNKITPYDGGWVYSATIASGQNCHRLGEELVRFGWQYRVGPGSPEHTSWIWIRPGFSRNAR